MTRPYRESTATSRRVCRTALGYGRFNCRSCRRRFNERIGSPFNDLHFPSDVVFLPSCGACGTGASPPVTHPSSRRSGSCLR